MHQPQTIRHIVSGILQAGDAIMDLLRFFPAFEIPDGLDAWPLIWPYSVQK
jgi:hypothetical protein